MLFQSYQSRKLEIDLDAISSSSPEVAQRLDRIASNYRILDELLAEVESKFDEAPVLSVDMSTVETKRKKPKPR